MHLSIFLAWRLLGPWPGAGNGQGFSPFLQNNMETIKEIGSGIIKSILFFAGIAIVILWCISSNSALFIFGGASDAGPYIETWVDINGNGKRDADESSLSNVCVWGGYDYQFSSWDKICDSDYFLTDSTGKWTEFFAGGKCAQIYTAATSPQGYRPTTPLIVNNCSASFGFTPDNSSSQLLSPDVEKYIQLDNERKQKEKLLIVGIGITLAIMLLGFASFKIIRSLR